MASSNEILTLQLGNYSNFVGTHWWNIQEAGFNYSNPQNTNHNLQESSGNSSEINPDVLYREGLTHDNKVTFTPRLLLVDLKGSLNALPTFGDLYQRQQTTLSSVDHDDIEGNDDELGRHSGNVEKIVGNAAIEAPYQRYLKDGDVLRLLSEGDMDVDTKYWPDFLSTRFHPRSVNVVNQYRHKGTTTPGPNLDPKTVDQNSHPDFEPHFDAFSQGFDLWRTDQFAEDFADKIRQYLEECNSFQGFHVLADTCDGFGGLAAAMLEHLQDEYAKKFALVFPLLQRTDEHVVDYRLLNIAYGYANFSEFSSLFVPLSTATGGYETLPQHRRFNHVQYKPELAYHSGAILAAALDTFSLRYRQNGTLSNTSLRDFLGDFTFGGKKMAALGVCLPFGKAKYDYLSECLAKWAGPLTKSVTPNFDSTSRDELQIYVVRGVGKMRENSFNTSVQPSDLLDSRCDTIKGLFDSYLRRVQYNCATNISVLEGKLPTRLPFPCIFEKNIDFGGEICDDLAQRVYVEEVPCLASLHSGRGLRNTLQGLLDELDANRRRFRVIRGFDRDDFLEKIECLETLKDCYD